MIRIIFLALPVLMRKRWMYTVGSAAAILALLLPPPAGSAQTPQVSESVLATPRMSYDASSFRATMMGHGWRELWRVPVKTRVLDLDQYAGGLTVVRRGGR